MRSFSLITATIGRATELECLFQSIASQNYPELECIVVDQNSDDRVQQISDRWRSTIRLQVLPSLPGLSKARNMGLAVAKGDILAFPDDDCWYTPSLLANVSAWFESHPEFDILTVGAKDADGISSGNRWIRNRCEIRPSNAFRTTFSSTIFVRHSAVNRGCLFDESLGVGSRSRFVCGEETDYILHLLKDGKRGYFDRTWHIGHPKRDMLSGHIDTRRASGYGRGMGRVLRKHSLPLLAIGFVVYDLLRSVVAAAKGSLAAAELCLSHAQGVVEGYFSNDLLSETPNDLAHYALWRTSIVSSVANKALSTVSVLGIRTTERNATITATDDLTSIPPTTKVRAELLGE